MNSPSLPYSYKSPALYNPRLWNAKEVRAYYVARPAVLDRIIDDLKREDAGSHPQHRLVVGLRGMGKSTLLRRVAVAVEDDVKLNAAWLPLSFPEEQYNVASLSDFWLNCLDALSDLLESRGQVAESQRLDAEVEQLDRKDGEGALGALLRAAGTLQRRLLLLVDNIDLVFERIKSEDWKLRDALQAHPEILIVGASAKVLENTYDYKAAFYDFFKIDELRGLSESEMRETIVNLARLNKADHIIERIDADPARLRVLHTLTGGNPRTAVLLYGVLLKGIDGDVRSDLEGLLDEVTPLYKARFEELPPLSQQLLDKLALHWHPASAAILAKQLGWKVNLVSAQLDRLIGAGIVEKVKAPKSKRLNFQIGERFFNIWYLMRTSRRLRRRLIWLVECLRGLYSNDELQTMAKRRMALARADVRDAETLVALSDAIDSQSYKRALINRALELLQTDETRKQVSELFDFDGEDKEIRQRHELIQDRLQVNHALQELAKDPKHHQICHLLSTSILDSGDYIALNGELKNCSPNEFAGRAAHLLESRSRIAIQVFGRNAAHLLAQTNQEVFIEDIFGKESCEALAVRMDQPYFASFSRAMFSFNTPEALEDSHYQAQIETDCKALLSFDDSGYLPWMLLLGAQLAQVKLEEATKTAKNLIANHCPPLKLPLPYISILLISHDSEWAVFAAKLLQQLDPSNENEVKGLVEFASVATQLKESKKLLEAWDSIWTGGELLPFREALNAAAHNDSSLLELLAPEVREPATQFLAVIAPKLLQQTGD